MSSVVAARAYIEAPEPPVLLVLRFALGALLTYAGATKLGDGWRFAETLANFQLLPAAVNQLLAVTLPWLELVSGLLLFFKIWVRPAALVGVVLFSVFTVAVLSALARGLDIACGCFGTGEAARVGLAALGIDVAGLGAGVTVLIWNKEGEN